MCNTACIKFGEDNFREEEIANKSILEVGACNINGSLREHLESFNPKEYLGVDICEGPGVDQVCNAENLIEAFGNNVFDILISNEMLEHVLDWRKVIQNMKHVLKPGGKLLITTRSKGFCYHGYPYDFWRYEIDDFKEIFSDFNIEILEKDPMEPGVYILATKPFNFSAKELKNIILYSIVKKKRTEVNSFDIFIFNAKYRIKRFGNKILPNFILSPIKKLIFRHNILNLLS